MHTSTNMSKDDGLAYAGILVEIGEVDRAELEVTKALDARPRDPEALSLLAKIKHMQGGLSQTILCWSRVRPELEAHERTHLHLMSILRVVREPEQAAGELGLLGGPPIVLSPTTELELEEAFALFLSGRLEESCFRCRELARRSKENDRETFKLAFLTESMIHECSGDLERARRVLERLGDEPGFATDMDRAFALLRIYERLDRPELLTSAVHLCRFLENRHAGVSILRALARLHDRLGERALAEAYWSKHDRAFRRRLHRPTMADVVRVASAHYVPLERLLEIRLPPGTNQDDAGPRERSLASALEGDRLSARTGFLSRNERLDQKYLADLAVLGGDEALSLHLHERLLEDDPRDLDALEWLLEYHAQCPSPEVVALLTDPAIARPARSMLADAVRATPLRASLWRRLAVLLSLAPETETASRLCHHQADAIELDVIAAAHPIGRVLASNVVEIGGRARGVVHMVSASRKASALGAGRGGELSIDRGVGGLTAENRRHVLEVFSASRAYAERKFPHLVDDIRDYDYAYRSPKADQLSQDSPAGLATAIAFLSVFLQRGVAQTVAVTGAVEASTAVMHVNGGVTASEQAIEAAYDRNLRAVLIPAANRAALSERMVIPRRVQEEIVHYVNDLDESTDFVFGGDVLEVSRNRPN